MVPFPVFDTPDLHCRYKTQESYIAKSKNLAQAAKPSKFTSTKKWADWKSTFLNYLRAILDRDGVTLSCLCRNDPTLNPVPNPNFIDAYIAMAPLVGESYIIDASTLHILITNFVADSETAEAKLQSLTGKYYGGADFEALKKHYEGVGVMSLYITKADITLENLHNAVEKNPHTWWDEFEK